MESERIYEADISVNVQYGNYHFCDNPSTSGYYPNKYSSDKNILLIISIKMTKHLTAK